MGLDNVLVSLCLVDLLNASFNISLLSVFRFLGFCHGGSVFIRYSRSRDRWNLFRSCYSPSDRKLTKEFNPLFVLMSEIISLHVA